MMSMVSAKAAAGDPASIRALMLLRVLGFDEERLRNTFQDIAEPKVIKEPKAERELEVWEILDIHVNAMKQRQRKRDYWKQRNQ